MVRNMAQDQDDDDCYREPRDLPLGKHNLQAETYDQERPERYGRVHTLQGRYPEVFMRRMAPTTTKTSPFRSLLATFFTSPSLRPR